MLLVLMLIASAPALFSDETMWRVADKARKDFLRRGQIWHKTEISSANILAGPQSNVSVAPETEVTCQYVEQHGSPSGYAPKFECKLPSQEIVRVKFHTHETYAEVAGT